MQNAHTKGRHLMVMVATMIATTMVAAAASAQASTCPAFPTSGFMTVHSHERMETYVTQRFDGDWSRLLDRLEGQLTTLRARQTAGRSVRLRLGEQIKDLRGAALASYIDASVERLAVAECLAERLSPVMFDAFATAAGEALSQSRPAERVDRVQVSVKAQCKAGDTLLKIANRGSAWPSKATLKIHRIDRASVPVTISRPMRMKANQVATFRVPKGKAGARGIGLFVEPGWYVRPFKFDAEVFCG